MFPMKFYRAPYEITAEEEAKLLNRREAFCKDTGTSANCREIVHKSQVFINVISVANDKCYLRFVNSCGNCDL